MTPIAYRDPINRDLFIHTDHTWVMFPHGVTPAAWYVVDETAVPDDLEVLAPLMSMSRRRRYTPEESHV